MSTVARAAAAVLLALACASAVRGTEYQKGDHVLLIANNVSAVVGPSPAFASASAHCGTCCGCLLNPRRATSSLFTGAASSGPSLCCFFHNCFICGWNAACLGARGACTVVPVPRVVGEGRLALYRGFCRCASGALRFPRFAQQPASACHERAVVSTMVDAVACTQQRR